MTTWLLNLDAVFVESKYFFSLTLDLQMLDYLDQRPTP